MPVDDSSAFPWRAVCQLTATFPDGTTSMGSGALVGDRFLLTAGHLVFSKSHGGYAKQVAVVPGRHLGSMPFGQTSAKMMAFFQPFVKRNKAEYDVSLIVLRDSIGTSTGYFALGKPSDIPVGSTFTLAGYPTSTGGDQEFYESIAVNKAEPAMVYYSADADQGEGGGPLLFGQKKKRFVAAVHLDSTASTSRAVRLDPLKLAQIRLWIATLH